MGQSATTSQSPSSSSGGERRRTLFSRSRSGTSVPASSQQAITRGYPLPRRKTIFQQIANRINKTDDSSDEENNIVDDRVFSLPMEFIQYRRGWFERHEEYAQQFDQKHVPMLSHQLGLINSDIIPLILSFLDLQDCCNFSATCKVIFHYWLGDPWFWFMKTPNRVALHIQKYQPFSLEFIDAKNWRDLAMIFVFNKTWRCIDSTFQIKETVVTSTGISLPNSYFYFKNPDEEHIVKKLLFGVDGNQINVQCKTNKVKYLIDFGKSIDEYKVVAAAESKTQCIMFINLFTGNGSREMLCIEKFSKHYARHDFLIVLYYWPKLNENGQPPTRETNRGELNNWRNQSELNFAPYLEYLEPISSDEQALSFFQLVLKWKAFNRYLKTSIHSPQDKHRGTIEDLMLSYCSDYKQQEQ